MSGDSPVDEDFARFVRAHTPALLRTAYLLTSDRAGAEELVQDTFVRLYPRWELVQAAAAPLAYVRRAVANQFVNSTRRPWRREVPVHDVPDRPDDRDPGAGFDDRDQLWTMLATLPDRQRTALVLRYFHDLPDAEIGAALGCRLGTVRSLISRGLATLRGEHADARFPGPPMRNLA
jgi:RNA polymerase sigma-70 factor (sigma-E family)